MKFSLILICTSLCSISAWAQANGSSSALAGVLAKALVVKQLAASNQGHTKQAEESHSERENDGTLDGAVAKDDSDQPVMTVIPIMLASHQWKRLGWQPGDEIWVRVALFSDPQAEPDFMEAAEAVWWLGEEAMVVLGAAGVPLPQALLQRGIGWVQMFDGHEALSEAPLRIHPRKNKLRFNGDVAAITQSFRKQLPGVDAAYLAQVAHFLAANIANLDVKGTTYSVSGYGQVINGSGEWTGEPIAGGGSQNTWATFTTSSGMTTADSPNDVLEIQGTGSVSTEISGDTLLILGQGITAEVDGDPQNELQDLFSSIQTDNGMTTADQNNDTLEVFGLGLVTTSLSGDTLTIEADILNNSLDFSHLSNSLTLDATTQINMDLFSADLLLDGNTLTIDSNTNRVGMGTATPEERLHLDRGSFLQTPTNPVGVGNLAFPVGTSVVAMAIQGTILYLISRDNTLYIVDISNPNEPFHLALLNLGTGVDPSAMVASGNYVYYVDGNLKKFVIIDVANLQSPTIRGSMNIANGFDLEMAVSGQYVYIANGQAQNLRIVDVTDPDAPRTSANLNLPRSPLDIKVSGHYAYLTARLAAGLIIVDISNPSQPALVSTTNLTGGHPVKLQIAGQYAYIIDFFADHFKVVDISNVSAPFVLGALDFNLDLGAEVAGISISGHYAYVATWETSSRLLMIDVQTPSAPVIVGSGSSGNKPGPVVVSGNHAFVSDLFSPQLRVVELSGADVSSMTADSLQVGQAQVHNDLFVQGNVSLKSGLSVGAGGLYSAGDVGIGRNLRVDGTLELSNDTVPTSFTTDNVRLYSEDVAGSAELKVRDEAGNVTTLSPHNFSLLGAPSEPMAWSFFSQRDGMAINVDMLRAIRLLEKISGEKLVHLSGGEPGDASQPPQEIGQFESFLVLIQSLQEENRQLHERLSQLEDSTAEETP